MGPRHQSATRQQCPVQPVRGSTSPYQKQDRCFEERQLLWLAILPAGLYHLRSVSAHVCCLPTMSSCLHEKLTSGIRIEFHKVLFCLHGGYVFESEFSPLTCPCLFQQLLSRGAVFSFLRICYSPYFPHAHTHTHTHVLMHLYYDAGG